MSVTGPPAPAFMPANLPLGPSGGSRFPVFK